MKLGNKIKAIRKSKDYTLKQLSDKTGLSLGFLSNIERDLNSPSISNLQQICYALEVNLMEILSDETQEKPITRVEEREEIFNNDKTALKVERLLSGKESLNGIAITIKEKGSFHELSWGHDYDEIGIVVKGELEIELDKTLYHLYEGDSIFIKQNTPHRYRNPDDSLSTVYWFSSKK